MKDKLKKTTATILGQKAEEFLKNRLASEENHYSDVDIIKLTHKLEVYQIELELQNDELYLAKTRAEEEAKKYTNLYDFAPSGYFTLSKSGEIIELNFSGANLLGKERSFLLQNRFEIFVSDQTRPIFNVFLEDLFETKTRQTYEIALANPSLYLNLSGIISDDEEQCLVTMHDISQLKKAELDIKISEENYHNLYESNRDSITIFRLDSEGNPGKIIKANKTTTEIFGYTQKELLSMSVSDVEIVDEELRKTRVNTLLKNGKLDFETIIRDKKGNYRFVDIETVFIEYENEPAVMNITRDITERKQLEENSRKAQENLTTLLEAIPDLLFEVGMDSKIYYYQAHRQDLLAIAPDEIIGKYFKDIMPADVTQICLSALKEADEKGWSIGKQYSLQLPHGKHWFELSVSPIHDKSNASKRFIILARDITERKLAEEKLVASEYLLNQTQNIAHLASYILDFKTGEWTSSAVLNSIFGIDTTTEKNIELWVSILHREWKSIMTEYLYKEVIGNKSYFNKEYKIIKSDTKEERWVHGMGEVTFDDQGNPLSMIGSIQDITERKIAQEKQKNSENNYRTLFNTSTDNIFLHEFQTGIILDINDTAIKNFGYHSKDEFIGNTVNVLNSNIPPYTNENALKYIQKTINEGDQTFEWMCQKKDGTLFWNEIMLKKTEIDGVPRVIAVGRDITDRKLAENELQENRDNLQSIFDSVSEAIYVIDQNGTFIDVNKGAEKMYQYTREELIGKNPQTVAAPGLNNLEEVNSIMQSVFENGIPQALEFWAVRKNGEIFPKEVVANRGKHMGKDVLIVTARDISERKIAEKALRKSDEKLKNIFNLANSGIILADVEGNFLEFNNWWLKMTGYTREEYSKMKNFGVTHPDDLEKSKLWLQKIFSGEIEKYQIEKRYVRKDKSIFWGESSVSAIKNKNNQITSTIGIVTDITERKLAEELLRESEEKYRGLVENSPDGIITYVKEKVTYVNAEALRIVGASSAEQIVGKSVLEFVHPDCLESVIQRMKDVLISDNASQIVEEKLLSLTGETIYAELKAIPTIFEHQNAVQVIIHDITERKRTQDKIKQLSQAVEQSPVAIVITNTLGIIEYVNPKFIETTGYSYEELIGKNPRILKSGHTSQEEYKHLWNTLSSGNEWFGEFHNMKKDGTLYWESASISPILNSQGITTHYIAIKEDITDRKLIEQQLIKAKEKAEESDRLKLAFLANMSHEIRTPMNGILGFTELLKDKSLTADIQQDYIKIIEKSGKRMLNIINDIINISKVESGQIEVTTSETNVNEQIEYLHTFFKPEASHKNIDLRLTKELDSIHNFIRTDREKLYAILTNLIKNALKFTNEGYIEFGCEKRGDYLEFFVKDSGLGISDSQKKIIFERFRQANDVIGRTHEGSGLGLAISKAYVEMLGGKIWVESQEGIGSTFYFTLPYQSDYIPEEKNIVKNTISIENEENKINDLKVLIVEDDAISKLLITIAVKPFSNEILKVSTGYEAVEACRNNPDIDLVMMDINMPEMGGYEATKHIRKFNKDLVIIAQTANGMQSDHDEAIAAGCTDYISKPINIGSLSKLIHTYFRK
jgi:PAS domain S-box-containing protein